jgi:hypothetical protein
MSILRWKAKREAYFRALYRRSLGITEENHEATVRML